MADEAMERLAGVMAEGTMRAAALMLRDGRFPKLKALHARDAEGLCQQATEALRETLKAHLAEYMEEWRNAVEARMPEATLRGMLNIQCNHAGALALRKLEDGLAACDGKGDDQAPRRAARPEAPPPE